MNLKNLNKLIAHLERISKPNAKPKVGFNMNWWRGNTDKARDDVSGHRCGTTACIGGHINILQGIKHYDADSAGDWLGLSPREATELFFNFPYARTSIRQAINTLKKLARTGTVDWKARAPRKAA